MWKCTKCGELIEDNFDICWKCGIHRDGSPPSEDFETQKENRPYKNKMGSGMGSFCRLLFCRDLYKDTISF